MTEGDSAQPLDGKSAAEQLALARAIIDAEHRGLYPLSARDKKALAQFIALVSQRRPIDEALLRVMNRLVRNHQQNLIALARSVR
jgi:hypothetical protein